MKSSGTTEPGDYGRSNKPGVGVHRCNLYVCDRVVGSINSHYFHIIGDGHQPNSRGLYTHYKDSLLKVG